MADFKTVQIARNAMSTRFEIVQHGDDEGALRAAAEEAMNEIEALETQLSLYQSSSEIAHVNARAARGPVRVAPNVFRLLQQAQKLSAETGGAFDITIAPLVRCWGFMDGVGELPSDKQIEEARSRVGMHHVILDETDFSVQFDRDGVMLDLGAIGKGYAIERAAGLLREAGSASAILHGGTSTVFAIGKPRDGDAWKVAIENSSAGGDSEAAKDRGATALAEKPSLLDVVSLRDEALSVSAVWGKCFRADGKTFGHVLDPHSGQPASRALLAAVALPSATETDAFSTALLALGSGGHERIARLRPGIRTWLLTPELDGEPSHLERRGPGPAV